MKRSENGLVPVRTPIRPLCRHTTLGDLHVWWKTQLATTLDFYVAGLGCKLARRYADHPALAMWHVHNEYGAPISESYDVHSVRAFRAWLAERYGSVEALNAAWGTTFWGQRYADWAEVDAPRTAATTVNQAQRLDFARFTSDALLACYTAERDVIRQYTPDLAVTTNFMATNCPSLDYWKWAREVDVVANDHYLAA